MNNIAMHILDIVQNSISAKAKLIEIIIKENSTSNILKIGIKDNGTGIDKKMLLKITDPYTTSRTTRKVGMGIPLLKHSAEQAGGKITIQSEKQKGTTIQAVFQYNHIDCPPLGDIAGTIVLLVVANPEIDFKYIHHINDKKYLFDTKEVKEALGDMKINNSQIRTMLKEMITENLNELREIE